VDRLQSARNKPLSRNSNNESGSASVFNLSHKSPKFIKLESAKTSKIPLLSLNLDEKYIDSFRPMTTKNNNSKDLKISFKNTKDFTTTISSGASTSRIYSGSTNATLYKRKHSTGISKKFSLNVSSNNK